MKLLVLLNKDVLVEHIHGYLVETCAAHFAIRPEHIARLLLDLSHRVSRRWMRLTYELDDGGSQELAALATDTVFLHEAFGEAFRDAADTLRTFLLTNDPELVPPQVVHMTWPVDAQERWFESAVASSVVNRVVKYRPPFLVVLRCSVLEEHLYGYLVELCGTHLRLSSTDFAEVLREVASRVSRNWERFHWSPGDDDTRGPEELSSDHAFLLMAISSAFNDAANILRSDLVERDPNLVGTELRDTAWPFDAQKRWCERAIASSVLSRITNGCT